MKAKLMLLGVAAAVALTGCSSVPQAPKDEAELIAMGEDNLLHVPVDLAPFIDNWKKVKFVTEKGDYSVGTDGKEGQTTIWTNPVDGKMYDLDGQPVNEKGERILANGFVCVPRNIFSNRRFYTDPPMFSFSSFTDTEYACAPHRTNKRFTRKQNIVIGAVTGGLAAGGVAGAAVVLGSMGVAAVDSVIHSVTEDDTW